MLCLKMSVAIKLFCALLCPGLAIGLLVGYSSIGHQGQNFSRHFGSIHLIACDTTKLSVNSFVVLTVDADRLLLHSRIAQRLMLEVDLRTLDTSSFIVPEHDLEGIEFQNPHMLVNDSDLIIADGSMGMLLRSDDARQGKFIKKDFPAFSLIVQTTDTTFVLRTYNASAQQDILTWINTINGERHDNLVALQKQMDGILCVDGSLLFNRDLQRIVYVYYYRNEFVTSDAVLKSISRGRTIDETDRASIEVDTYEHNGELTTTFKSPPHLVNKRCATDGNYLYVVSDVKATNQERLTFDTNYTIDRYNLVTFTYDGSFLVKPPKDRHDLKNFDFVVSGNKLIAIFDDQLFVYALIVNSPALPFEQDPK